MKAVDGLQVETVHRFFMVRHSKFMTRRAIAIPM
jgi:hypothetical protein